MLFFFVFLKNRSTVIIYRNIFIKLSKVSKENVKQETMNPVIFNIGFVDLFYRNRTISTIYGSRNLSVHFRISGSRNSNISEISGSRNSTIFMISGSRIFFVHFLDFWIKILQYFCTFWI